MHSLQLERSLKSGEEFMVDVKDRAARIGDQGDPVYQRFAVVIVLTND